MMLLSESYKKRLLELAGLGEDAIDTIKKNLFQRTNSKLINKYLNKHPDWFNEKEKLALQIQSGQVEKYDGDLYLTGTQIQSLGNLKSVGGYLYLKGTQIQNLGNLESVDGYLYLIDTQIQSLGNLESVGGNLDLKGTQIQSLGNLKSVGGYLNLENTPNLSWENIPRHLWGKVKNKEGRPE